MIHDDQVSNRSGNRPFEDILRASLSRRNLMKRSAGLSVAGFVGAVTGNKLLDKIVEMAGESTSGFAQAQTRSSLLSFTPVKTAEILADVRIPRIAAEYQYDVLIPWGTPLQPGGAEYKGDPNSRPTATQQTQQVGIGHDGMWFFAKNETSNTEGMLCVNHEYGTNPHILGKAAPTSLEDVRLSQHAHGMTVIAIKKENGKWRSVASNNSRRIHLNTPVKFSGAVASSDLLKNSAGNPTLGTLNNCANGYTPWGTYLTCEENFNGYFGDSTYNATTKTGTWTASARDRRYGFSATGFGYGWEKFDPRFDLSNAAYQNERNRFGWVMEVDPNDGKQTPVKRTALGRFKHEGIALTVGRGGRAVGYMGDDERNDYCYKFVSRSSWRSMRARGISPLDQGTLYVAKFKEDGTGEWLALTIDDPKLKAAFKDQAEVLTYARVAADLLGATPMDRPEWTTVAANGNIFWSMTNNTARKEVGPGSPLAPNPDGHILEMIDSEGFTGLTFRWRIPFIARDTHGATDERTFSSPDGLWVDPDSRLFIQTDGTQKKGLNDQMLVADLNTGEIRRLFSGVAGCEVTGVAITPDRKTMFVNLQHPGDGDPKQTNFPAATDGITIPRDATIVITRKDGGIIGS